MSKTLSNYLQREHARLDREIATISRHPIPDQFQLARLKKLKLAVKDQLSQLAAEGGTGVAA